MQQTEQSSVNSIKHRNSITWRRTLRTVNTITNCGMGTLTYKLQNKGIILVLS